MLIDALSVTLRALSFVALFQAAAIAIFLALLDHELKGTERPVRQLAILSALVAALRLLSQYVLKAARMSGELGGVMDPALQGLVSTPPPVWLSPDDCSGCRPAETGRGGQETSTRV
jgi:hypothetical protein